jgi:hypothetical protein
MAIFKQIVQVNNGNTGWTTENVISALEEVFANLGWHAGSTKEGVIRAIIPKYWGGTSPGWRYFDGLPAIPNPALNDKTWDVTKNEQGDYVFDQIEGDGEQNGENIDIVCNQGDILTFNVDVNDSPFYIVWDNAGGFSQGKVLNGDYSQAPINRVESGNLNLGGNLIKNLPSAQGVEDGTVTWNTTNVLNGTYYYISGTESAATGKITINPRPASAAGVDLYDTRGSVRNPWAGENWSNTSLNNHRCYYDVTIPAGGTRSAATFRVYRMDTGRISGIDVLNAETTFGWSDNEVFTIPGTAVGGTSPTHDIVFDEVSLSNPSIRTTTLGGGTNFYQKNLSEGWGILKTINNPNKKYGTSYYTFNINSGQPTQLFFNSGWDWSFSNLRWSYPVNSTWGPGSNGSETWSTPGYFTGYNGVDRNGDFLNMHSAASNRLSVAYCRSTTPTSYPLAIRVYKAQSPQDGNFAIIQFTQTVNESVERYATFFLHKGPNYGAGIWDLNHVYQGGVTLIGSTAQTIHLATYAQYGVGFINTENTGSSRQRTREALYGYFRDTSLSEGFLLTAFVNNINYDLGESVSGNRSTGSVIYYREAQRDALWRSSDLSRPGDSNFSSSSDYYKVIKGLPLSTSMIPVPYYLPDDFTLIQFETTPGSTLFQTGDTITVSPSEVYEIVISAFNTDQASINGTVSQGIAFCARVV